MSRTTEVEGEKANLLNKNSLFYGIISFYTTLNTSAIEIAVDIGNCRPFTLRQAAR